MSLDLPDNSEYYLPSEFCCTPLKFQTNTSTRGQAFCGPPCVYTVSAKPMVSSPGDAAPTAVAKE